MYSNINTTKGDNKQEIINLEVTNRILTFS